MLKSIYYDDFIQNNYGKRACVLKKEKFALPVFNKKDCQQLINTMFSSNEFEWIINGVITKPMDKNFNIDINNIEDLTRDFCFGDNFKEEEFTFSGHNCHHHIPELQIKSSQFLYPIFKNHGIPSNGVNIFIFGGKYKKTPVGLHSDACDIFLFPIIGHKKLFTWEIDKLDNKNPKYINGKINARKLHQINYLDHIDGSTVLEANEGDAIYFPAGTWHINDYEKIISSISIGISIFRNADSNLLIYSILKNKILDKFFAKSGNRYKVELINHLLKELKLNILQKQSSYGFITDIKKTLNATKIMKGLFLEREKFFNIYSVRDNKNLYLIANGKIIRTLFCKKLLEFIYKINSIENFTIDDTMIGYEKIIKWLLITGLLKIL